MKVITLILLVLLGALQFKLWFGEGGLRDYWQLEEGLATQAEELEALTQRNQLLVAEVYDLKHGTAALEEKARSDLGLVHPDEEFYQVVSSSLERRRQ